MFYCISASLITAAIYLIWFAQEVLAGRGRHSLGVLFFLIAVGLGSAIFEVFDFAPIFWTFDAHSLFHAATIPTPLLLAEFAILEAKYEQDLTKTRNGKEY
uniref:Post-GPI attachment to proteins factor 3 n=1 Tax=Panagrolaimus superbus TaxID=310955 RepID=A0A914YLD9_9BILA